MNNSHSSPPEHMKETDMKEQDRTMRKTLILAEIRDGKRWITRCTTWLQELISGGDPEVAQIVHRLLTDNTHPFSPELRFMEQSGERQFASLESKWHMNGTPCPQTAFGRAQAAAYVKGLLWGGTLELERLELELQRLEVPAPNDRPDKAAKHHHVKQPARKTAADPKNSGDDAAHAKDR